MYWFALLCTSFTLTPYLGHGCFSHRTDPDVHAQGVRRDASRHRGSVDEVMLCTLSSGHVLKFYLEKMYILPNYFAFISCNFGTVIMHLLVL